MKILFLTLGNQIVASSRTRVYQFLPHLKKAGIETRVIPYDYTETFSNKISSAFSGSSALVPLRKLASLSSNIFNALLRLFQTARFLSALRSFDIIYIQKLALPLPLQRFIKKANPRIVFDFDDAVFSRYSPARKERFDGMITSAGLITVENDYTANYARQFNNSVLYMTGPIDCGRYKPREKAATPDGEVVIGWIGSDSTTAYLSPLAGPLKALCDKYSNVRLEFIGAGKISALEGRYTRKKWGLETEADDIGNFDIGLMPLHDDEWTRGKGGYKLLQYMAAGIPSVASPVGINSRIILEGRTGFLASTAAEWLEKLEKLITDTGLRVEMGRNARREAEEKYSFEFYTPLLAARLEALVKNGG